MPEFQWCHNCKGYHKKIVALYFTTGIVDPLQLKLRCLNCGDKTYTRCSVIKLQENLKERPSSEYKKYAGTKTKVSTK